MECKREDDRYDDQKDSNYRDRCDNVPLASLLRKAEFETACDLFKSCKWQRTYTVLFGLDIRAREDIRSNGSDLILLEIELLRWLDWACPRFDHIVELIAVIENEWTMAKGQMVHFNRNLAKGVSFLQDNDIPHLDIKSNNLICAEHHQLQIINFDTSVRVLV